MFFGQLQPGNDDRIPPTLAIDRENYRATIAGAELELTPRAFDVLCYLIDNRHRVVEKADVFQAVWQGAFVTDNALTRVVRELRKALNDSPDSPRYIQTVPKRGYRFVGTAVDQATVSGKRALIDEARPRRRWLRAACVTLAAAAAVPLFISLSEFHAEAVAASTPVDSVVVLPFIPEDGSPTGELELIRTGLKEQLILSNVRTLPDSSLEQAKLDEDPQIIGRMLGVRAVLTGRYTTIDGRTTLTVELLDTSRKALLWSGILRTKTEAAETDLSRSLRNYLDRSRKLLASTN